MKKKRGEVLVRIPTGVVTVPASKVRTFYRQLSDAKIYLRRKEKGNGTKENQ